MNSNTKSEIILQPFNTYKVIKEALLKPALSLMLIVSLHALYQFFSPYFARYIPHFNLVDTGEFYTYWLAAFGVLYWGIVRSINTFTVYLSNTELFTSNGTLNVLLPFISTVLKTVFCLTIINLLFQYAPISSATSYIVNKLSSILIIAAITWIVIKLIDVVTILLLNHYQSKAKAGTVVRKVNTQIFILKKLVITVIVLLSVGCALMLFENVRALGASVLTTAGIAGLVFTFAAQRSLGSVLGGLEIALAQPIKIGDLILIENEFGTVEEINFRSVIIKLWDLRRLSVPTSYFLEKPFQNWSRKETSNLIGSIFLYVDFTLPLSHIRQKVEEFLKESQFWDGETAKVQVHDLKEQVMQLRILASAKDSDDLANLKSEIREKLISYIVQNYPGCLPTTRTINFSDNSQSKSSKNERSIIQDIMHSPHEEAYLEEG
jgi:hypothetical protein